MSNKLDEMENYFGDTRETATFIRAYSEYGSVVMNLKGSVFIFKVYAAFHIV
jgi:hypothetical protein